MVMIDARCRSPQGEGYQSMVDDRLDSGRVGRCRGGMLFVETI